jgi:hypothetical protein
LYAVGREISKDLHNSEIEYFSVMVTISNYSK